MIPWHHHLDPPLVVLVIIRVMMMMKRISRCITRTQSVLPLNLRRERSSVFVKSSLLTCPAKCCIMNSSCCPFDLLKSGMAEKPFVSLSMKPTSVPRGIFTSSSNSARSPIGFIGCASYNETQEAHYINAGQLWRGEWIFMSTQQTLV